MDLTPFPTTESFPSLNHMPIPPCGMLTSRTRRARMPDTMDFVLSLNRPRLRRTETECASLVGPTRKEPPPTPPDTGEIVELPVRGMMATTHTTTRPGPTPEPTVARRHRHLRALHSPCTRRKHLHISIPAPMLPKHNAHSSDLNILFALEA